MYKKISDYGIIGNLRTVALVGLDCSIDWLCLPFIDSPTVFCALLDDTKGGRFSISPRDEWDSVAEYITGTNILKTKFRTRTGTVQVIDFMPIPPGKGNGQEEQVLFRSVEVLSGNVPVRMIFDPRFNYARSEGEFEKQDRHIIARGNRETLVLSSSREFGPDNEGGRTEWDMHEGEKIWLRLRYGGEKPP